MGPFRFIGKTLRFVGWGFDFLRRLVLNLVFFILLLAVLALVLQPRETLPDSGGVLLIKPQGVLVESRNRQDPLDKLLSSPYPSVNILDDLVEQTALHDQLEAIHAAATDPRIAMLVIQTDDMSDAGLSKLAELRDAIATFKKSGKPVLARANRFSQGQYYLASIADEISMQPDGVVLLTGFARYSTYYKNALDKLGIKINVFRVGEYKSFSEPFTRTDMSEEDRRSTLDLLNGLWNYYREGVAAGREITMAQLDEYIIHYPQALAATGGDTALAAKRAELVDHLQTEEQWRSLLQDKLRIQHDEQLDDAMIPVGRYLSTVRHTPPYATAQDEVAVLVAQGSLVDGDVPLPDTVNGTQFAQRIQQLRNDDRVKAVVLRVDSPGGSVWASEQIRHELELLRNSGKKVVVSMSSVAASGGYWISTASDQIWAHPVTLTGSIGIFAMVPNFAEPFNRLGLTVDGVRTAPLAGAFDPRLPLSPEAATTLQLGIERGYQRFLELVAQSRHISLKEADLHARGRVWLGATAVEIGLADHLGGLQDAIAAAAKMAQLTDYAVTWPGEYNSPLEKLRSKLQTSLLTQWMWSAKSTPAQPKANTPVTQWLTAVQQTAQTLSVWNDPQHQYAHCLCESP